ncbi:MAG: DUF3987 domain-containing protein [Thermodesulfobacteriota bacterium]
MIGATVGRYVSIEMKDGWQEPLIFWVIDINESGGGKTAKMQSLASVFRELQRNEQERARLETIEWETMAPQDRGRPADRSRAYYCTDLTLEGLRADLDGHSTGGILAILAEASSLISGQNEYKNGKGTDRESWLRLYDGHDVRISRASRSMLITGARVSVIGGIQPLIFQQVFGKGDKQFLKDGTIYRGLFTYAPSDHHTLTPETWADADQQVWEDVLKRAFAWVDGQELLHRIHLNEEGQSLFLTWRNDLDRQKFDLPPEIRGFLPKAYGTALRLAAAIDLIHCFHKDQSPRKQMGEEGVQRGIDAAMFYLGQAVDATRLILGVALKINPMKKKIRQAIRDRGTMTATEINEDVFKRNIPAEKIQAALNEMVMNSQLSMTIESTDGRPRTIYVLHEKNELTKKAARADQTHNHYSFNSFNSLPDEIEI